MEKKFNQENYQFLTETLSGLGFENFLNDELRTKMNLGLEKFEIKRDRQKDESEYTRFTVSFERGRKDEFKDRMFLNRIVASDRNVNGEIKATAEFKIFKKNGFNVNEMINLLEGRPVHRERNLNGEMDPKWFRLDIKNPNEDGIVPIMSYPENVARINIDKELSKLNIIWKSRDEKNEAILDLKSGHRIYATARIDGRLEPIGIEVSPQITPGLAVMNKEGDIIKYTNAQTQSMKVVNEEDSPNQKNQQAITETVGFKVVDIESGKDKKISETTIQVMEAANNTQEDKKNKNKIK